MDTDPVTVEQKSDHLLVVHLKPSVDENGVPTNENDSAAVKIKMNRSVAQRFYMYRSAVEYCLNFAGGTITRNGVLVGENITRGSFDYTAPSLQRSGVVHLSLRFSQNGESSDFEQDVQVLNVP